MFSKLQPVIRIREFVAGPRSSLAITLGLGLICLALVFAHGAPGLEHMSAMDHDSAPAKAVVSLCLAVLGSAVAVLGVWRGLVRLGLRDPRPVGRCSETFSALVPAAPFDGRARASPARLQVFLR